MTIIVTRPTPEQIDDLTAEPTWSAEVSVFDWHYDTPETCYVLEGDVRVTTPDGEAVEFGAGDLVTFPQGLSCTWEVRRPIRKHYRFG